MMYKLGIKTRAKFCLLTLSSEQGEELMTVKIFWNTPNGRLLMRAYADMIILDMDRGPVIQAILEDELKQDEKRRAAGLPSCISLPKKKKLHKQNHTTKNTQYTTHNTECTTGQGDR